MNQTSVTNTNKNTSAYGTVYMPLTCSKSYNFLHMHFVINAIVKLIFFVFKWNRNAF